MVAGRPPHPTAAHIAMAHSVDLSGHAASPLGIEAVRASDVIFVMDIAQLVAQVVDILERAHGRGILGEAGSTLE